jgi:hypothetical protein
MPVRIAPYSEQDIPAVKDFNRRLQAGGAPADYVFSESHVPAWLPPGPVAPVYNEFYLAQEDGMVRGTFVLKHQEFAFHGSVRPVVYYHHPYSEGIVDKKYAQVGLQMLMHAVRAHPVLYALGMGGYDRPLPRMLMAMKWNHCLIPFYFRVNHPAKFLRNMQTLRQSGARRAMAGIAAFTGAGWAGLKTIHAIAGIHGLRTPSKVEVVAEFEDWADEIWEKCGPRFAMIAVRDARSLRAIYPGANRNFLRLKISAGGRTVGWAVAADVQQRNHPQYGNLRVGTILDCLAAPEDATRVIAAAVRVLSERRVDVITSNQSHAAWVQGLKECGFLKGPSNFIFAASKKLSEMIQPFEETVAASHWTRGDGDNLLQYA